MAEPEGPDDRERVHLLPEQVRRIEVGADDRTDRVAQPAQRGDVVDEVERMQLEGEPIHPMGDARRQPRPCQSSSVAAHCRSSSAIESAGHGYQVKLTAVDPGPSPGLPDIVTSLRMPSSPARRIVERMSSTCRSPCTGWSGQAEQLSAAIRRPRLANASANDARAARVGEQVVDVQVGSRRLATGGDLDAGRADARGKVEGGIEGAAP